VHVYDFITDQEQHRIKTGSRSVNKDQPFEMVLSGYRDLFLEQLDKLTVKEESNYLNQSLKESGDVQKWLDGLLHIIQTDGRNITQLFADLIGVYEVFISGKHQTAVSLLYYFLEKYDLLDNVYYEMLGCFFRGRYIEEGKDYMEESFYYHIPFNQRFRIKNQRFSFSGLPLLYAGESLMSTFFELGAKDLEDRSIAVATFNYDHLTQVHMDKDWQPIRSRNRIFDITNSIYDVINDLFYEAIENKTPVASPGDARSPIISIRRAFRKFILSQVCTFPREQHIKDQHFVEEYVLPQLLTEAVRQHKYDGILYPSTRFIQKKVDFGKGWHNMIFKANIAMFTNYVLGTLYDEALFKTIVPHVIDLTQVGKIKSMEEVGKLLEAVHSMESFLLENTCESELRGRFVIQLAHFKKKIKTYEALSIDGKAYLDTYAGKVETVYMKEYFKYIRVQVMKVYPKEVRQFFGKRTDEGGRSDEE